MINVKFLRNRRTAVGFAVGLIAIGVLPRIAQSLTVSDNLDMYASQTWAAGTYNYDMDSSIRMGSTSGLSGASSILIGYYNSSYVGNVIVGGSSSASLFSASFGLSNYAGTNSITVGRYNYAAYNSAAFGHDTTAQGNYTSSFGVGSWARSRSSTVVGQYNSWSQAESPHAWTGTSVDTAFVVGIGSSNTDRKNALEVYQNGDVVLPKRQGDLVMGIYGNPGD